MNESRVAQLESLKQAVAPSADQTVDALGLFCPMPLVKLGQAMRAHSNAQCFELLATDRGTAPDLLDWAPLWGHDVLAMRIEEHDEYRDGLYRFWVMRGTRA